MKATDGNFYGTTSSGGSGGNGTVFKITPAGTLTTLYSFAGSDGANPYAGLVQAIDGNFYGTTYAGGSGGYGTVFKVTPAGALTTLHSFAGSDGANPQAGVRQGTDGNFYGTTSLGGTDGYGTIFKITSAGALTTLHSFAYGDGAYPYAGLVQETDGRFYGTTSSGGTKGYGTIFKITPAGALTTLHSLSGSDGADPRADLVQGSDGNSYGTTYSAGARAGGVVFRLTPGPGPSPTVTGVSPANGPVSGGTVVTVSGTQFQPGAAVTFGGTSAIGITYVSETTVHALTPVHAAGAVTVAVTNPDLQTGSLPSAYTYSCSWTPTAFNGGPYCVGDTVSLSTPTVAGATYAWTGPNGFASALQNPTIPNATAGRLRNLQRHRDRPPAAPRPPGTTSVVVNPVPAIPVITAPALAFPGATGLVASVPLHAGSSYSWGITNGTITAGATTNQITFTAGTSGHRVPHRDRDDRARLHLADRQRIRPRSRRPARRPRRGRSRHGRNGLERQRRFSSRARRSSSTPPGRTSAPPRSPSQARLPPSPGPAGATYSLLDSAAGLRDHRPRRHRRQLLGRGALLSPLRLQPGHPPRRPLGRHLPRDAQHRRRRRPGLSTSARASPTCPSPTAPTASSRPSSTTASPPAAAAATTAPPATSPAGRWPSSSPRAMVGPTGTVPDERDRPGRRTPTTAPPAATPSSATCRRRTAACKFIHYIYAQGITAGCGGGNYCPACERHPLADGRLPRYGHGRSERHRARRAGPSRASAPTTAPRAATPSSATSRRRTAGCRFIHYIYAGGVTAGCGGGKYCPASNVTRWQMAPFLVTAFHIPLLY